MCISHCEKYNEEGIMYIVHIVVCIIIIKKIYNINIYIYIIFSIRITSKVKV